MIAIIIDSTVALPLRGLLLAWANGSREHEVKALREALFWADFQSR
jgi:hypothetical protein